MHAVQVQAYVARANDFFNCMKFFADARDPEFRYSSVLLAIHSAISCGDALCVGLGKTETSSQDHELRVFALRKLLYERKYKTQQGLKHFENLPRDKTDVA